MASHRVIEDSDEDIGDIASPELLSPSAVPNEIIVNSMMQSSSTDPMLFRAVYEEHLGQLLVDDPILNDVQPPTLEDPIFNQRMSSSLSIPSARKLKRSKTINISSLSSVTEPTLSTRRAMCAESTKVADDLTQITTPRKSREATRCDPWEVPSSNGSNKANCGNVKLKSRSYERNANLKTYGRQIRRSQTVTHSMRSASYDLRMSSPMEDESPQPGTPKIQLQDEEGDCSIDSESRPRKRARLNDDEIRLTLAEELSDQSRKASSMVPGDHTSIRTVSASEQTSDCISETVEVGMNGFSHVFPQNLSSPSTTNHTTPATFIEDHYQATKPSTTQALPLAARSIVVIPDILSEEQKSQYDNVSVASTIQSLQSSQPDQAATVNSNEGFTEALGIKGDFSLCLTPSSGLIENESRTISQPSRSPVSPADRKMKRANSEVALKKALTHSDNKILKRRVRSKTIGPTDKLHCREVSVDELCVTSLESVQRIASKGGLARNRKNKARCENEEDRMRNDELQNYEETAVENEKYEPRPNLHQPKGISTQVITDSPAGLTKDDTEESPDIIGKQASAPALESTESELIQPKRRVRKRKSEVVAAKAVGVHGIHNDDSPPTPSKDHEVQRKALYETDSNKQPLQETAITPPAERNTADFDNEIPAPAQTPTRDSKKGPEQHSPLQSGKMPYRVGLSKKTRIAPLLKMIRK